MVDDKESKPKVVKSTDEKIQSHVDAIRTLCESEAKKQGKSPENLAFDKLMSPVVSAIQKGKEAQDDKRIGDEASKFSRLATPTAKDYERLIRVAGHRWFVLQNESAKAEES